jgi:transcriptional regulator with XRE-family HTH domain
VRYEIRTADQFGNAIAEFRELRGTTQSELANEIGVQRSYLSAFEQGAATQALERLLAACEALDVSIVLATKPTSES